MKRKTLHKIFTSKVISVSPEMPVLDAIPIMEKNKISCLVIVQDKRPVGIFTERDFVMAMHRESRLDTLHMRELMNNPVITTPPDTNIYEAYNLLETNRIRHLVIVDDNGELAGLVTQSDIMKNLGLEYFVEIKNISKIMTKNVMTVKEGVLVRDAISRMAEFSISCVIIEKDKYPVGMLTERDVVRLFREGAKVDSLKVEDVMTCPVLTIPSDAPVHEASRIMKRQKIRRLVVVDKSGTIAGLITQSDIIKRIEDRYINFLKDIIRGKDEILQQTKKILSEKIILENILRSSIDIAIVAIDLNFQIVYYNPVAEKIFGYKAEKIIGKTVMRLHEDRRVNPFYFEKAVEIVKTEGEYKFTFEQKKGEVISLVESTISGIFDNNDNLAGFVLMARDVTERKKLEEEFLKAQKLESVGVFASGIVHDFNNLLAGIMNCMSLSKSFLTPKDKAFESLTMAEKALNLAKDLTQQLLTFAKTGEPVREKIFIADLIKYCAEFSINDALSRCEISIQNNLWPVEVDTIQISRVIQNLLFNAKEAMPHGGTIRINAGNVTLLPKNSIPLREGRYIKISIKDEGDGIPEEHLQRIFDPYFTTKRKGNIKGTGLGLAICYSIIKKHKGYITVESEKGRGSTFNVYLPVNITTPGGTS